MMSKFESLNFLDPRKLVFDMDPHENIISSTQLLLGDKIVAAVNELRISILVPVAQSQYLKYIKKRQYEIKEIKKYFLRSV